MSPVGFKKRPPSIKGGISDHCQPFTAWNSNFFFYIPNILYTYRHKFHTFKKRITNSRFLPFKIMKQILLILCKNVTISMLILQKIDLELQPTFCFGIPYFSEIEKTPSIGGCCCCCCCCCVFVVDFFLFRFVSFRFVSFRFVSFRFVLFCFVFFYLEQPNPPTTELRRPGRG